MLVSAKFENIYSFSQQTQILFTAGKSDSLPMHVSRAEKRDDISVLRMGLIYGANASGKSNIVKALSLIRDFALLGWTNKNYCHFKMTDVPSERSMIELEFKVDGQFFAYGAAFCKGGLLEEWLYKTGSRTDTLVFERQREGDVWRNTIASHYLKGENGQFLKFLVEATPTKGTFLSYYASHNGRGIDAIASAVKWFRNLTVIYPDSHRTDYPVRIMKDEAFHGVMRELLQYFATGISDLRPVKTTPEELHIPDPVRSDIEEKLSGINDAGILLQTERRFMFIENKQNGMQWSELKTIHRQHGIEADYVFDFHEESDGTARLFDFIPMLIDMRANDAVYIIDEIDRSLHPMLTLKLLELYDSILRPESNMQLICTTHESNLLASAPVRQDEVWFVEKDRKGESHLASLCEYKPRENVQKGYLNGRYGAIPFFGELNNIHWEDEK